MTFTISDTDIANIPGIKDRSEGISILPRSATEELVEYSESSLQVRKVLQASGLTVAMSTPPSVAYREERSILWVGPILFIAAAAWQQNPHAISIALSVIANYVTDIIKGQPGASKNCKLKIHIEEAPGRPTVKTVEFEGPAESIRDLETPINSLLKKKDA